MSDVAILSGSLMAGVLIGGFFFGGLWWTVQKSLTSNNPVLWFFGSTLLRTGFAMAGFYFTSRNDWQKLLVCLLGFVIARIIVTRFTRTTNKRIHAP
jgi:F1F0 ATPase subunit 2